MERRSAAEGMRERKPSSDRLGLDGGVDLPAGCIPACTLLGGGAVAALLAWLVNPWLGGAFALGAMAIAFKVSLSEIAKRSQKALKCLQDTENPTLPGIQSDQGQIDP